MLSRSGLFRALLSGMLVATSPACVDSGPLPQKNTPSIVGKWDSKIRSGDSDLIVEFFADGSFKQHSVVEREGHYSLKDNKLTTYVWDNKEKKEQKRIFDLTLDGNQIAMKDLDSSAEIRMNRTCKAGPTQAGIVGEWFSTNYPGAIHVIPLEAPLRFPAFVEFTKDKKIFFRSLPIRSRQGQFEYSSGMLVLRFPGEDPLRSKTRVSSDQTDLKLTKNGPEIPFRQVLGSDCGTPYVVDTGP
jgi:hypothetical protein